MTEERFVNISKKFKEKRPYRKCPNCGEVEYTEYKKKKISRPNGYKGDIMLLATILSLGLFAPILEIFTDVTWEKVYKECSECYYREAIKND